ncbi:unnamed protein product, partial [Urochloa humidicola]
ATQIGGVAGSWLEARAQAVWAEGHGSRKRRGPDAKRGDAADARARRGFPAAAARSRHTILILGALNFPPPNLSRVIPRPPPLFPSA